MKCLFICLAASAAIISGVIGLPTLFVSALAQTQGTPQPVSLGELFADEDSVDLAPAKAQQFKDAVQRGHAQGQCHIATTTVVVKQGDPLFQHALVTVRRDVLRQVLGDQARYVRFETRITGTRNDVRVEYDTLRDEIPPTLDVTWTPPKGTRVKPGDRIKAVAMARDDANLWQSGISGIDLVVLPESNSQFFGFHEWPREPLTCERIPPPRTLEGVYTVPESPPPIIRLAARTKDFANHEVFSLANFPTGDWTGHITWEIAWDGDAMNASGKMDLSFEHDAGRGDLSGALVGDQAASGKYCSMTAPGSLQAKLVGQYTPDRHTMSLQLTEHQVVETQLNCQAPSNLKSFWYQAITIPEFNSLLRSQLRSTGDGAFQAEGDWTLPSATMRVSVRIRRSAS